MLSRIAENLFWMGRYIERSENTARLLQVNYLAILEAPQVLGTRGIVMGKWEHLLDIMESREDFIQHYQEATAQNVPYWLALHEKNPASIRSSLAYARENARALRDRISTEMWESLNKSYHSLCLNLPELLEEDALNSYCTSTLEASHLFFGIAHATLPHDLGWYFMRAGQFLERADNTLRTLQANLLPVEARSPVEVGVEIHRDIALLKSMSAYEAYRKYYISSPSPERIYEFLLFNKHFPRSVTYSLKLLASCIRGIQRENPVAPEDSLKAITTLLTTLTNIDSEAQITVQARPSLRDLIDEIALLSHDLHENYFGYQQGQQQSQMQS